MKKVQILGISRNYTAILYDLLLDAQQIPPFVVYQNLETEVTPAAPVTEIKLIIHPPGVLPEPNQYCYFGTGNVMAKAAIFRDFEHLCKISQPDYPSIIHQSVYVAPSANIGHGCVLEPHVSISSQTRVNFGVNIRRGAQIGHHNSIGAFSEINPGVVIAGCVTIGEKCSIGAGAVVRDGVTIGNNTVVGMGSVVTKNLPANVIAYGNPCKVVKQLPA